MIRMNDLCVQKVNGMQRRMVCTRLMNEKTPAGTVTKEINNNNSNNNKPVSKEEFFFFLYFIVFICKFTRD